MEPETPAGFTEGVDLPVRISAAHVCLTLGIHLIAAGALMVNDLFHPIVQGGVLFALFVSLASSFWEMRKVRHVHCLKGAWRLQLAGGAVVPAQLIEPVFAGRFLLVLRFRFGGRKQAVVITRQGLPADVFRRARVYLRWGGQIPR